MLSTGGGKDGQAYKWRNDFSDFLVDEKITPRRDLHLRDIRDIKKEMNRVTHCVRTLSMLAHVSRLCRKALPLGTIRTSDMPSSTKTAKVR
jgi:hypothetical protein